MGTSRVANLMLYFISLITPQEYKLLNSSLCIFLQPRVASSHLSPNIVLRHWTTLPVGSNAVAIAIRSENKALIQ